MKKLLIATAMSTAFAAAPAFADATDSTTLTVNANVLEECSIETPTAVTIAEVEINEGAGSEALELQNGSQSELQQIYVSCNYATTIAVTAGAGLLNAAGATVADNDPDDFTNLIHYRVELESTDGSYSDIDYRTRTASTPRSATTSGAFHDQSKLRIRIDADDTAKRPVAGTYTDTATITIGTV